MKILELLKEKNEYPIIFIGSGMSIRYLEEYPNWENLLKTIWSEIKNDDYFKEIFNLKIQIKKEVKNLKDKELDFLVNIKIASKIEKIFIDKFSNGEIEIEGINYEKVVKENINPFKYYLSNKFLNYKVRENKEIALYKAMLKKSRFVLTTNYDKFIEDLCLKNEDEGLKVYIGQKGLFKQTTCYSELYKIHGCISESESIIITEEDYKRYEENSVLISAKIISTLLNSPIIFLGYSLTDQNVRSIIKNFVNSLNSSEKIALEERIILVQRESGSLKTTEEILNDEELGCRLTLIKTDNYIDIYKEIVEIDQGATPAEIAKYQYLIKDLLIDYGKKGEAKTVLVGMKDIEELKNKDMKLAVAMGTKKTMLTLKEYLENYLRGQSNYDIYEILKFLSWQNLNSNLPILKIITKENLKIYRKELGEEVTERLNKYKEKILKSEKKWVYTPKIEGETINEIESKDNINEKNIYGAIAYNIDKINISEIKNFLLMKVSELDDNTRTIETGLRKLLVLYDLKNYKK